jgi:hypothetical protein
MKRWKRNNRLVSLRRVYASMDPEYPDHTPVTLAFANNSIGPTTTWLHAMRPLCRWYFT